MIFLQILTKKTIITSKLNRFNQSQRRLNKSGKGKKKASQPIEKPQKPQKPKREMYDLDILNMSNPDCPPLWTNKAKMNMEFPFYKFDIKKSIHKIDDNKKASKKESWQTIKLNASSDHAFAESILKVNKRNWMYEYLNLLDSKIKQNETALSLQGLKVHKSLAQVYEHFNWIVWAVSHYYFENHMFDNTDYGLPPVDNDAWIDGFMWKDVYFRLVPILQISLIKQEIEALKHITLEIEECL